MRRNEELGEVSEFYLFPDGTCRLGRSSPVVEGGMWKVLSQIIRHAIVGVKEPRLVVLGSRSIIGQGGGRRVEGKRTFGVVIAGHHA